MLGGQHSLAVSMLWLCGSKYAWLYFGNLRTFEQANAITASLNLQRLLYVLLLFVSRWCLRFVSGATLHSNALWWLTEAVQLKTPGLYWLSLHCVYYLPLQQTQ